MRFFKGNVVKKLVMSKDHTMIKIDGVVVDRCADKEDALPKLEMQKIILESEGFKRLTLGSWVITKDHIGPTLNSIGSPDDSGTTGPGINTLSAEEIKQFGKHFMMYDDDGVLYYEGYCIVQDGLGQEAFAPLDDFGEPNSGCTYIKYRNAETNKYEIL